MKQPKPLPTGTHMYEAAKGGAHQALVELKPARTGGGGAGGGAGVCLGQGRGRRDVTGPFVNGWEEGRRQESEALRHRPGEGGRGQRHTRQMGPAEEHDVLLCCYASRCAVMLLCFTMCCYAVMLHDVLLGCYASRYAVTGMLHPSRQQMHIHTQCKP